MVDKQKRSIFKSQFSMNSTSFRRQLAFTFATGIIVLALSASFATYQLTSNSLRERLIEEGLQHARVFAEQSPLALLYQSPDNAIDFSKSILASPDVLGVGIYTLDHNALLQMGEGSFGPKSIENIPNAPKLIAESDLQWLYIAPVYSHDPQLADDSPFAMNELEPELLGYIRLIMSKKSLIAMAGEVLQGNFTISIVLAVLLLLILLAITSRLIKPLGDLASIMLRAEHGDAFVRADIHGPKDIADMQHAFNTMMDVLESRENDLVEARDMALESARIKGEFAANVTHELRTPLNGILGMLQLLDGPGLSDQQLEYVSAAQTSAEALLMLINDILDFSKIDAGKAVLQTEVFYLDKLSEEVVRLLSQEGFKKGIDIRFEIDDNTPLTVKGDIVRIRQVLFNLMGNAIKFTHEGEAVLRIRSLDGKPGYQPGDKIELEFSVKDTGIGISDEAKARIFDAFTQADGSTSRNYGGTGLGLSISKRLVSFMGGSMRLESEVDKGSCFYFWLPLVYVNEESVSEPVQDQVLPQNDTQSLSLPEDSLVLVVDDNRTNQQVAKGMLERLGCRVDLADNGEVALELLSDKLYDIILMDIQMPGMDGYEATVEIRKLDNKKSSIPIIAMTAIDHEKDIKRCLDEGMNDFLSKPFKLNALKDMLAKWLIDVDDQHTDTKESVDNILTSPVPAEPLNENTLVLDKNTLEELRENAGSAFAEMIEVYLEDQLLYLDDIERAIEDEDRKLLKRASHTLKGSSRNFGACQLSEMLKEVEDKSEFEDFKYFESVAKPIRVAANELRVLLSSELDSMKQKERFLADDVSNDARILVVDDDRSMRLTFSTVLENDGYQIDVCSNGSQAVEYCEQELPDLILMDAMMPGIDGFAACKQLREMAGTANVPILMITALDDESSIDRAFASGANDFITKPVNFAVLRQRILRLLDASRAKKHAYHLSYHDTLTGLPNRRTFVEKLEKIIQKPHGEQNMTAVMFLGLDRFKLINDTMGHEVGDILLKSVTGRIKQSLRSSDVIARLGGDEFAVILDNMKSAEVIGRVSRKICDQVAEPFEIMNQQIYVTISIGIALYPVDNTDVSALMKYADTAMSKAKDARNSFQFYEIGMEVMVAKRIEMESEMRQALERDEFILHYQPQIDVTTGAIAGMEALVRWQHPVKGMVPPGEFIPLAEETGLIGALGEWVLRHACMQLKQWLDKGYPALILSVNISGRQLEDKKFIEKTLNILDSTGIPLECLELEITESVIMKNPEDVIQILEVLKSRGISLAIDDFGTGHSSLNYLRRFPIDTLKIDRSFVNDITNSPDDAVLVNGIIALAKSLNLKVIAEGVETYEQKIYLQERGCDWIQGFYLYKPMPADIFEKQAFFDTHVTNF